MIFTLTCIQRALLGLLLVTPVFVKIERHSKLAVAEGGERDVPDSYIVLMEDGAKSLTDVSLFEEKYITFRCDTVLNGHAVEGVPDDAMMEILNSRMVKRVYEVSSKKDRLFTNKNIEQGLTKIFLVHVQDLVVELDPMETEDSNMSENEKGRLLESQLNAPWGLDRIDARSGLNGRYNYDYTGNGVTIFVVDGGVLPTHTEYSDRYEGCMDFSGEGCEVPSDHGTFVAGVALGTIYGVAKEARVHDIKVYAHSGDGSVARCIAGFDEVARRTLENPDSKYVVSGSFG